MSKRFWIVSALWVLTVILVSPALIEWLDRSGHAIVVPGFPVTASEIALGAVVALLPPVACAAVIRRR